MCDEGQVPGNFWIALPAAVATLLLILILSFRTDISGAVTESYHLLQIVPYILVLVGGIIGVNVFVVLLIGIVSGAIIMLAAGHISPADLLANVGNGASGMFETSMVAILVAALCALIREYGGFDALLAGIHKVFKGKKGGQLGMGLLVGAMDVATANNTVAIVMANPIAKEMAEEYGLHRERQRRSWIHFLLFPRGLFRMVHRCWWRFQRRMNWDTICRHFRSCRSCFIRFCCWLVH